MSRAGWIIAASLLLAADGIAAEPECSSALNFSDDGAIVEWAVCDDTRASQSFVARGERSLDLRISVERQSIDSAVSWQSRAAPDAEAPHAGGVHEENVRAANAPEGGARPESERSVSAPEESAPEESAPEESAPEESAPAEWRFRGVDSGGSLEVVRTYRRVDADVLEHTIDVTNASDRAVRDVVLALDSGGALPLDHAASGGLADYFYRFHRAMAADDADEWAAAEPGRSVHRFAQVARHKALIIESAAPFAIVDAAELAVDPSENVSAAATGSGRALLAYAVPEIGAGETLVLRQRISALPTEVRTLTAAGYAGLTYAHLSAPIAWLSTTVERVLVALSPLAGPGLAVILLAVAVRAVTLPASLWSARRQSEFASVMERMRPEIASARAEYSGAEQSERILGIYKAHGISPFSGLKGSVGLFLQIPFLLAVFNVTTVSSSLYAEPFLWIDDLSLPDAAAPLPASVMILGSHFNVLPLAMGMVFLLAPPAGTDGAGGFKTVPVLVTLLMVALVYSFASALLLYWLAANTFQAGERFAFRRAGLIPGGGPS